MKRELPVCLLAALLFSTTPAPAHDQLDFQGTFPAPGLGAAGSVAFSSSGIQLMSWLTLADLDGSASSGNDCWGYVSGSGREYAIIGTDTGTCFVEITDPCDPVLVDTIASPTSLWRDVKTYQDHAYAVTENSGGGIQVFDLSAIDSGTVSLVNTINGTGCTDATHNVAIDTAAGKLYRCGGSGAPCSGAPQGLVIYDLSTPSTPVQVGLWTTKYVHDAQVVTWDVAGPHFGKEIAFCAANDSSGGGNPSLYILDVTNPASISVIGSTSYSSPYFSHQVWLTKNKDFVYLNDELDEQNVGGSTNTRIIDVSDLTAPFETGTFTSGATSIDHNLYVHGDLVYEANYRSGLRVFDNSTPTAPVEIAHYDTYPADDAASFNSLWSVYPFLPSGTIIGSDLEKGLFVWRLGDPLLTYAFPDGRPELVDPAGQPIEIEVIEDTPGDLDGGSVELFVDTGSGFQSLPMTSIGGTLVHGAPLPSTPCGQLVRYYVSATSTDGCTWLGPPAAPTQVYTTMAALHAEVVFEDDVEVDLGWTVGDVGDTATTGIWERGDPIGTAAQSEDDHTEDPGTDCWFTGQGTLGGAVGENDIDGGVTTLTTPTLDASGLADPLIGYWRWFSNDAGSAAMEDVLEVHISNDGGSSWMPFETVGPTGEVSGGWVRVSRRIDDFVTPSDQMRLRFRVGDLNSGSIVEAAIDDVTIEEVVCTVEIASVSPDTGSPAGGNSVTILGDGFVQGVTEVCFGAEPSPSVNVLSPGVLVCEVPGATGRGRRRRVQETVTVVVQTGPGVGSLVDAYTYGEAAPSEVFGNF